MGIEILYSGDITFWKGMSLDTDDDDEIVMMRRRKRWWIYLSLPPYLHRLHERFRVSGWLRHVCINKQSNLATDNVISRDKGQDIFELFPSATHTQTHPHTGWTIFNLSPVAGTSMYKYSIKLAWIWKIFCHTRHFMRFKCFCCWKLGNTRTR